MDTIHFLCFIFLFNFHSLIVHGNENNKSQTYIVRVEQPDVGVRGQSESLDVESWQKSSLPIIGATSFNIDGNLTRGNGVEPPIDEDGHGTHTAGTAAGHFVNYAEVLGNAKGKAVGMAPLAHLAIYKVCFGADCAESNELDAAIEEGVDGTLKDIDVKGKVVLCERGRGIARVAKGQEVKIAGGAAMILMNQQADAFSLSPYIHVLPATHVSYAAGLKIKAYINSTIAPTETIFFRGTVLGDPTAPSVSSFSSRGPSLASPGILKPNIISPGMNMLAAWSFPLDNNMNSKSTFKFMSGTSKSCPHLSGIAALLKRSHPNWLPAAIKSAMMTSTDLFNIAGKPIVDETLQPAHVFATGAGHVNPSRADNPGFIYDIQPDDYIPYLCCLGYKLTYTRTVTNVGVANSQHEIKVIAPKGVDVIVEPSTLYFSELNQKATYSITFTPLVSTYKTGEYAQGYQMGFC
ncbi:subtilisin-like protease SDD1-like [Hibiscus syriacus]|uniref:Subtilisin-like protease SDD1-like n=1 Tax=Hibiscus syriacus TaxID=106335 RepID=A0A6A3BQQ2_HIBSY|nr:subtilisin-like protease SDD1-like [Hibiscus syriacus]